MSAAPHARLQCADVLGIEINASAVLDARFNAQLNDLEGHSRFVCSPAHVLLQGTMNDAVVAGDDDRPFVAVVDPSRTGLEPEVRLSYSCALSLPLSLPLSLACTRAAPAPALPPILRIHPLIYSSSTPPRSARLSGAAPVCPAGDLRPV